MLRFANAVTQIVGPGSTSIGQRASAYALQSILGRWLRQLFGAVRPNALPLEVGLDALPARSKDREFEKKLQGVGCFEAKRIACDCGGDGGRLIFRPRHVLWPRSEGGGGLSPSRSPGAGDASRHRRAGSRRAIPSRLSFARWHLAYLAEG